MARVLVLSAGGPASEGVIKSLNLSNSDFEVFGAGADSSDYVLSSAKSVYPLPYASDSNYEDSLLELLRVVKPEFIHAQNDSEIVKISSLREEISKLGVHYFLPEHQVIETCVNKWKSYQAFSRAGLKVPENIFIDTPADLIQAFKELTRKNRKIWLRSNNVGGGGMGAVPTDNLEMAKSWINHFNGWGNFIAAELLSPETVTWQSIWKSGELVVAQTRKRAGWVHGNRTLSGVTGVTKLGQTCSDPEIDEIGQRAIKAVDAKPHGIYGVDLAYDLEGIPNPTEINIGRFFTTILFFTKAGLNMPEIYVNLTLNSEFHYTGKKLNPLPNNLLWFRGMDTEPKLMSLSDYEATSRKP